VGAEERVRELVEPVLADRGLELYDVEHNGGILRISVDREGGVLVDDLAKASRVISVLLDEEEPISGRYTLEVSSPGLERNLRTPAHHERAVGSVISVKLGPGTDGDRRLRGTLAAADDEGITLQLESGDERRVRYDEIQRAKTVLEWGPNPRPGKGGKKEAAKR
jgi:ribosome maturation factor RimP